MKKSIKIIALAIFVCFFFSFISQNIVNSKILDKSSSSNRIFSVLDNFENKNPNLKLSINYLNASSSYDYGFKVGKLYRFQLKFLNFITNSNQKNSFKENQIEDEINFMESYCPQFLDEFRGLSDSLNIEIEKLLILQKKIYSLLRGECTATVATGDATKNNETFLTFNLDNRIDSPLKIFYKLFLNRLFSWKCWVIKINTLRYKYALFGMPIIYELAFLNEEGLGWASPGIPFTKNQSRYVDEGPGISTMLIERLVMMTCKNVTEAANVWKNVERANQQDSSWYNQYDGSSEVYCDKEGGILAIEQTHNYIITAFGNSTEITGVREGILWHANHHKWLDPFKTGSVTIEEYPSSGTRDKRAGELLNESYGNITLDVCKQITRDHGGGFDPNGKDSGDICRHFDKTDKIVTAFSWIILPKKLTVYWTHRSPCRSLFWKHDFSKIFGD